MNYAEMILSAGASLLFLALVFIPMEKMFPAKADQKTFREHWFVDLCFLLGQHFIWNGLVLTVLTYVNDITDTIVPNAIRNSVAALPFWLQILTVLLLSDFIIYWGHRLQHNVEFLWRFHKVHHSSEHLDWLAAYREHPLDTIYTVGLINAPAFILGFDLSAIAAIIAFRGIWAVYIHSNVRLPIGHVKKIIGAPELHHWHHDIEKDRGNYANISPLMDIAFGTYTCPDTEPEQFGIKEQFPKHYIGQMISPLLPKVVVNRYFSESP